MVINIIQFSDRFICYGGAVPVLWSSSRSAVRDEFCVVEAFYGQCCSYFIALRFAELLRVLVLFVQQSCVI